MYFLSNLQGTLREWLCCYVSTLLAIGFANLIEDGNEVGVIRAFLGLCCCQLFLEGINVLKLWGLIIERFACIQERRKEKKRNQQEDTRPGSYCHDYHPTRMWGV